MQLTSDLVMLSQDLLHVAEHNKYAKSFKYHLANLSLKNLVEGLVEEEQKFVFWANTYNAFVQILLKENPKLYRRPHDFHHNKLINMAGQKVSLWQIENGIIRTTKKSKKRWFLSNLEKECRLKEPEVSIHFTLNQANKSSPPIIYYELGKSKEQIKMVVSSFLNNHTNYNSSDNILLLPRILQWYKADFGKKKGILQMLKEYKVIPEEVNKPKIRYKKYDWDILLNNFLEEDSFIKNP